MSDKEKPVVPGIAMTYVDYDGVPQLEDLSKSQLAKLMMENKGKLPLDTTGKPVMCYAIDVRKRWTGTDTKPVMCYAMPGQTTSGERRKIPRIMCYKRPAPKRKKKDDEE